jgi:hypothetical protein
MSRSALISIALLCACSAAPVVDEPFVPGVEGESSRTDPCDRHPEPAAWVRDSALAALQDQMSAICACFREDAEGVRLYVAAYLMGDGTVRVDILGHRSKIADQIECFQQRTTTALTNWVALGGGWFDPQVYDESPPVVYKWDGMSCPASLADLPINGPMLSEGWLETNPKGLLYPAEMPAERCYDRVRRHVRINFAMEVRPPAPPCENAWHPQGCPEPQE